MLLPFVLVSTTHKVSAETKFGAESELQKVRPIRDRGTWPECGPTAGPTASRLSRGGDANRHRDRPRVGYQLGASAASGGSARPDHRCSHLAWCFDVCCRPACLTTALKRMAASRSSRPSPRDRHRPGGSGGSRLALSLGSTASVDVGDCDARIGGGLASGLAWESINVRSVSGCAAVNEAELIFLQWGRPATVFTLKGRGNSVRQYNC
jgi:hypothetical protein